MKNDTRPDPLSKALQQLETRPASAGFTDGVLARLDARDARRQRRRRFQAALAAPAALVVLILGALWMFRPAASPPGVDSNAGRAEEIRRQHRLLREELEQLQRAADQRRTLLYLGANDEYDLVLDLKPLLDQGVDTPVVPALQDLRVRPVQAVEAEGRQP